MSRNGCDERNASVDAERLQRLRDELARPPFHEILKPIAHSVDDSTGEIAIGVPYQPCFSRSPAVEEYHGGVIAALIDIAGHAAAAVHVGHMAPTIDLRIDYLRIAPGVELIARARISKAGRTWIFVDVDVHAADKLVATGRGTFSAA